MKKRLLLFSKFLLCAVLALAVFCAAFPTAACAAVGLKVRPGLGGLYKTERPVELLITVENDGPGFSGLLSVGGMNEFGQAINEEMFLREVEVPADAVSQYSLTISGDLATIMPTVELTVGDLVLAKVKVEGLAISGDSSVALVLNEEIMGSSLPAWLTENIDTRVNLKYLSAEELPVNNLALQVADILMTDASGLVGLSVDQLQALREWLCAGGLLVLFDGPGAETVEVLAAEGLTLTNENSDYNLYMLGRGQVVHYKVPLRELGTEGQEIWKVLFGAYSYDKYAELQPIKQPALPSLHNNSVHEITAASAYIPELSTPSFWLLALLWLAYIAIVGPLLYFLLRRADRRDWTWVLVPLMALVVAGCFYLLAPGNRVQNYLTQTLVTIEMFASETSEVRVATAVVAAKGGDFTLDFNPEMHVTRIDNYYSTSAWPEPVWQDDEWTRVGFNKTEYGALRKVYAYGLQQGLGNIEGEIQLSGSTIEGRLLNKTGFDLRDCVLLLGDRVIDIGALPKGGAVDIEKTLEEWADFSNSTQMLLPGINRNPTVDPSFRENTMLSGMIGSSRAGLVDAQFLGWSDELPELFELTGLNEQQQEQGLTLLKQTLRLDLRDAFRLPVNPTVIPYSNYSYYYTSGFGGAFSYVHGGLWEPGSSIEFAYNLGRAGLGANCRIDALAFQAIPGYATELYHWQQDSWDAFSEEEGGITGSELEPYLNDNTIRGRTVKTEDVSSPYYQGLLPGLALEGVCLE